MISKNSFLTSMKENCKRRSWVVVVSLLTFFFYFPVSLMILIQSTLRQNEIYTTGITLKESYMRMFQSEGATLFFSTAIAILCAVQGFSYLYKRKKVDLYYSVPVSKAKRFGIIYLNGILIYAFSYLVNLCLGFFVVVMYDGFYTDVLIGGMKEFIYNIVFFLCVYNITILAVMLTGTFIVTLLAGFVLLWYEILVRYLFKGMQSIYFSSYVDDRMDTILSPIGVSLFYEGNAFNFVGSCVELFVLALIWGIFAYLAYYFRPLESSGRAMAFEKSKGFIKILLMIPTSLFIAMFFYSITNYSDGMGVFGLIVGILLSHALIESIYEFDLHAVFHNKRLLFLGGVLSILLFMGFRFDLTGYDSYIPKAEKIESVGVSLRENLRFHYTTNDSTPLENVNIEDTDPILFLAQKGVEYNSDKFVMGNGGSSYITVCYNLKNGKKMYRYIAVDYNDEESVDALGAIYNNMEYKESAYQIFDDTFFADYVNMEIACGDGRSNQKLSSKVTQELIKAYRKDITALDYKTRAEEIPKALLIFYYSNERSANYSKEVLEWDFPVYDSFTETIAILEREKVFPVAQLTVEEVLKIEVTMFDKVSKTSSESYSQLEEMIIIQTKEDIEQMLPYITTAELQAFKINDSIRNSRGNSNYDLNVYVADYSHYGTTYVFKHHVVPDVLVEQIKNSQK